MPGQGWKSATRSLLKDEGSVLSEFLMIFFLALAIIFFLAGFALSQYGVSEGLVKGLNLAGLAFLFSLFITIGYNSLANFLGKGLFSGSNKRDDAAIMKGMYKQAHGLRITNQPEQSEKIYQQILMEYPDELEARLYLGDVIWKDLNEGKRALKEFMDLEYKIFDENLKFKYITALRKSIRKLREEVGGFSK